MSALANDWLVNYRRLTQHIGSALTATIEGVAVSKPCLPVESPWNRVHAEGGGGEEWEETRELQMLVSDFTRRPRQHLSVRVTDDPRPARLEDFSINNGVYYLRIKFVGTGYTSDSDTITADSTLVTADYA